MDHSEELELLYRRKYEICKQLAALQSLKEWGEFHQREYDRLVEEKEAIQRQEAELMPPMPKINWNRLSEILAGIKPKKSESGTP